MLFHILCCFVVSGTNVSTDILLKQQSGVAKLLQLKNRPQLYHFGL